MPRAADQFRQSDVTLWGIVALVVGAVAILSANVSALVPDSVLAGLHASRLDGANLNAMRSELDTVEDEQARLRATSKQLGDRFGLAEETAGDVGRRVSALEVSVPKLLEAVPARTLVDVSTVTGSIGAAGKPPGPVTDMKVSRTPFPGLSFPKAAGLAAPGQDAAPIPMVPERLVASLPTSVSPAVAAVPVQPMPSPLATTPAQAPEVIKGAAPPPAPVLAVAAASSTVPVTAPMAVGAPPPQVASASVTPPKASASVPAPAPIASGPVPLAPLSGRSMQWATADQLTGATADDAASKAASPDSASSDTTLPDTASADTAPPMNMAIFGVALGPPLDPAKAASAWQDLTGKAGPLLGGMKPLLAENPAGTGGEVIVAGPLTTIVAATTLCSNFDRLGVDCMPMPYVGRPVTTTAGH